MLCSKRTEEEEGNKMEERPNWTRYLVCVGRKGGRARWRIACVIYVLGRRREADETEGRTGTDIKISGSKGDVYCNAGKIRCDQGYMGVTK